MNRAGRVNFIHHETCPTDADGATLTYRGGPSILGKSQKAQS
jgi:hypothetical protein